jgi:hypothetical protein
MNDGLRVQHREAAEGCEQYRDDDQWGPHCEDGSVRREQKKHRNKLNGGIR